MLDIPSLSPIVGKRSIRLNTSSGFERHSKFEIGFSKPKRDIVIVLDICRTGIYALRLGGDLKPSTKC
jgi:hypothetical protein